MKFFTKEELIGVFLILFLVFSLTFRGLQKAQARARDAQRKADLGVISDALHSFYEAYGYFPLSQEGKIKMCKGENFEKVLKKLQSEKVFDRNKFFEGLRGCEWGKDSFQDLLDENSPPFLKTIPSDPKANEGISYLYLSNTKRFQIYSYLEEELEDESYNRGIVERNLNCGVKICSFGKSFSDTPLDLSIEEYEEKLQVEKERF